MFNYLFGDLLCDEKGTDRSDHSPWSCPHGRPCVASVAALGIKQVSTLGGNAATTDSHTLKMRDAGEPCG